MKKILFLAAHRPGRSPGQRFRFEQYLPALEEDGFTCEVSFLLSEKEDRYFYQSGHYFRKFLILLRTLRIRWRDLRRAGDYDIVFLYREAVMYGSVWFEKRLRKKNVKLVLDFDDAIWLKEVSEGNRKLAWMKRASKTEDIIRLCHCVITGNDYLASYAKQFNSNVIVIPTTLDTAHIHPAEGQTNPDSVCIGWTGSITTLRHLDFALPVLQKIRDLFPGRIRFRVIADKEWTAENLPVEFIPWSREHEIRDLSGIDIGIMPLPDNDWARGKCGFKGLQYMALGIPALLSPVGVNTSIIQDGVNGFLPANEQEWTEKLSLLVRDAELRKKIGAAGRKTVEEKYSFHAWKDRYTGVFNSLLLPDSKKKPS